MEGYEEAGEGLEGGGGGGGEDEVEEGVDEEGAEVFEEVD